MDDLLSRKFLFAVMVVVMGFILVITNKVTVDVFFNFAEVVGGTYVIGNLGSKFMSSKTK